MKKLLGLLIVTCTLVASAFSFGLSLGGNFQFGGNVGNTNSDADGLVIGGGFMLNTEFIGGFGVQAEVNTVTKTVRTGENSITFASTVCNVKDVPIMAWYNYNITDAFEVGGGAGINLGFYTDRGYQTTNNSTMNIGFALGGNLKYNVFSNFGLVLGLHTVFDFLPTTKIKSNGGKETTYVFGEGLTRKAIYATLGVEIKLLK